MSFAQLNQGKFKTSVFVLNAASPSSDSSFYVIENGDSVRRYNGKLQVKNKRLSIFKIENINPLRYYYFINNQLVSQFMENSPSLFGKNVSNQGNVLSISAINFLKLFSSQKGPSGNGSDTLYSQEKLINNLRDSIIAYQKVLSTITQQYDDVYDSLLIKYGAKFSSKFDTYKPILAAAKKVNAARQTHADRYALFSNAVSVYESLVNEKLFSLTRSGILQSFDSYAGPTTNFRYALQSYEDLTNQQYAISLFPDSLRLTIERRSSILGKLNELEADTIFNSFSFSSINNFMYPEKVKYSFKNYSSQLARLDSDLQRYFSISLNYKNLRNGTRNQDYVTDAARVMEIFRVKKLLADFVFNQCDQFILKTTVDVGKLLQKQVFTLSRIKNDIQNYNYIDTATLSIIDQSRNQTEKIFSFVQNISADLSVYANTIQANGKSFLPYLNNIDSNYAVILDYLKVLDFVSRHHSTNDYTLPRTSNSANADLIRYTVSRIDKNTLATEDLTYDLWIKGGLKIDFSAGFFTSGIIDNQYQKVFISHDTNAGTDSVQVNRVHDGRYAYGFGGMVNIAVRSGANWFTPGIGFGFIYSTNQKLQIICGAALHLGKTERIILHAGIATGTSKTFDVAQFKDGKNTIVKNEQWRFTVPSYADYSIPALIDRFTVRPFFGISYNLSKSGPFGANAEAGQTKYTSLLSPASNSK